MLMWISSLLDGIRCFLMCFLFICCLFNKYVKCPLHARYHSMLWSVTGNRTDRLPHKTHSSGKKDALPIGKRIAQLFIFLYCFKPRKMLTGETFVRWRVGLSAEKQGICPLFSFLIINYHLHTFSSSLYWSFII